MPILGLRRPPPTLRPVSRSHTGPEDRTLLGCRLPSVVAPPPDGDLRLIPKPMHQPCNIAVDPRLCKGSVFAIRRQHAAEIRAQGVEDTREGRYRSRLESSLPPFPPSVLPKGGSSHKFSLPKASLVRRTSALKRVESKEPIQLPQLSPASIDKGFRKLKFVPLRNVSNVDEAGKRVFPSRVVPALGRVRVRPQPPIFEAPTPPCSERPEYLIVESGVQTDDPFDEETFDLVRDLANSAIELAMNNLHIEETLLGLTKKTEDIRRQLEREKQLKKEIEETSKRVLEEKEREIRDARIREEEILSANRLAVLTCKEVMTKSFLRLKAMEEAQPRTRSIGLDTRQLNDLQTKVDLVHAELEKDFFPWMFARAEKIYRNKWTYSQLQSRHK